MRNVALITPFLIGMAVLWLATCFFTVRQSVVGVRLVFLAGMLAWPMLSFLLGAAIFESTFTGNERPVGPAGLLFMVVGAGVALTIWLGGFWTARIVGWSIRRNRVGA
jgi:hypothetical protein